MERAADTAETDEGLDASMMAVIARVERAALARFGGEIGAEAAAEVRAWAWAHRGELAVLRGEVVPAEAVEGLDG